MKIFDEIYAYSLSEVSSDAENDNYVESRDSGSDFGPSFVKITVDVLSRNSSKSDGRTKDNTNPVLEDFESVS